jgi:CubicO group peptidase (beta-lactamase class C family)
LEPDRKVTDFVPEVGGTAYQGATVRHLLDMRAGVAFDEDYLATSGAIIAYRKATNWVPLDPGEAPSDLRSFYTAMTKARRAAWRPLSLCLAEHRPARLGDRAGDRPTVRRSDQ